MKFLLLTFLVLFAISSIAQPVSNDTLKKDSLYLKKFSFRLHPRVMMGPEKLKQNSLTDIFAKVPESVPYYEKYKRNNDVALYSLAGIFAGSTLSVISFDNGNRSLTVLGLLISILSFTNSIIFMSRGEANLKKAIKAYNNKVLKY